MALSIKTSEVERLASDLARLTGETKTATIRVALVERRQRLTWRVAPGDRAARAHRFLEDDVWPLVPADQLGRRWGREEEDAALGHELGRDGVASG